MTTESTPPPSVAPPWIRQWDASTNAWLFTNTSTGDSTYEYNQDLMDASIQGNQGTDNADQYTSNVQQPSSSAIRSVEIAPESVAYGVGDAVGQAASYQDGVECAVEGVKNGMAEWVSGAADAAGEDIEQSLSDIVDAPDAAVRALAEGVENVEQLGEGVGEAVADAPEKMVEGIGERMDDVQRFGEDVGSTMAQVEEGAMRKIDEGVENVREVGEVVQHYGDSLGQAYEQGREEERYD